MIIEKVLGTVSKIKIQRINWFRLDVYFQLKVVASIAVKINLHWRRLMRWLQVPYFPLNLICDELMMMGLVFPGVVLELSPYCMSLGQVLLTNHPFNFKALPFHSHALPIHITCFSAQTYWYISPCLLFSRTWNDFKSEFFYNIKHFVFLIFDPTSLSHEADILVLNSIHMQCMWITANS